MSYTIEAASGVWEIVVGLEVHAQVVSQSKLFSGASATYGGEPNAHVSFVDAAFPGMLPVINRECVAQAVRTGLGLNAHINLMSRFDRKNYFYADLPAGYQISQYQHPIVGAGIIEVELADGSTKPVGVTRLHLEQDAGKSLHDQDPTQSFIDLNRSGVALMEIVSEPDIRSPEEAGAYLRKLPDFEDFDAEQRALAHATNHGNVHLALHFLVAWPDLQRASQLVLTRTKELNGNFYAVLNPAADALDTRHPLAATLLRRAMIDFALGQARTSRYRHAARHLRECASLAQRVAGFGDMPDHAAYEQALRAAHGRKAAFWEEVAASR